MNDVEGSLAKTQSYVRWMIGRGGEGGSRGYVSNLFVPGGISSGNSELDEVGSVVGGVDGNSVGSNSILGGELDAGDTESNIASGEGNSDIVGSGSGDGDGHLPKVRKNK